MSNTLKIDYADNGYILTYGEYHAPKHIVVEEDANSEPRTMQRLLFAIIDYFGASGSKHDDERIKVIVVNRDGEEVENE